MKLQTTPWINAKSTIKSLFSNDSVEGILLIVSVIVAMVWANSPWHDSYHELWQKELVLRLGSLEFKQTLHHLINDGLMAIFFFVVGLEIKREVMAGELATWKKASLPVVCALGGMVFPALIYFALNFGGATATGWGVPMATDIAFTLVLLSVLGSRVPVALKVFVTALAVVDDLGAVLVIAFFYTDEIVWNSLIVAVSVFLALLIANKLGARNPWFYGLVGLMGVWLGFLQSGIHATIAGVLIAMAIPTITLLKESRFSKRLTRLGKKFDESATTNNQMITQDQLHIVDSVYETNKAVTPPLQRVEHALSPIVSFFILPLFALSNAGIEIDGSVVESLTSSVSLGIILGLVVGKFIGIVGVARIMTWFKLANLPKNTNWTQLMGAACLAGIGFTMSLFIAELAFDSEELLSKAKLGILVASVIAAVVGFFFFLNSNSSDKAEKAIKTKNQKKPMLQEA